ncbi:hypothetical protein [uncultured Sphingomonas sp.]|uniref:hypothetical protein n=1 Tax=uncultured Sphingomonas sp. TaxID=158754 RepID=UPI0025FDC6BB|nr:hypothetical protein [uncultured Sphingomonas sp.]
MRGMTAGSVEMISDGTLRGMIGGDVIVAPGVHATIKAMVGGDVVVERGASVRITGMVSGRVVNLGGAVEVRGMVAG